MSIVSEMFAQFMVFVIIVATLVFTVGLLIKGDY